MLLRNEFINDHRVKKEAESLIKAGYHVTILAEKCHENIPERQQINGIEIVRFPVFSNRSNKVRAKGLHLLNSEIEKKSLKSKILMYYRRNPLRRFLLMAIKDLRFCIYTYKHIHKKDYRFVHAHDLETLLLGYTVAKIKKIPIVYDSHELWQGSNFLLQRNVFSRNVILWTEKRLIRRVNAVIATNESRAGVIQKTYRVAPPTIVRNVPKLSIPPRSNTLREKLSLDKNNIIVLYQGLISKNRGIYYLVDSLKYVQKKVHIVFLGSGDAVDELKLYVIDRGLKARVHFCNSVPVETLPLYTASADIIMATYLNSCANHYYSSPNKIFEGIMAQVPLVMSNFPEMMKVAERGDVGEVVNPEDPIEIGRAINALTSDQKRIEKIKKNCLDLAEKYYNWGIEEKKLIELYNNLTI